MDFENFHSGMRVIRGPGWKWGNQDGGKGHAGTVITPFFRKDGGIGPRCPSRTRMVQWDNGDRGMYRGGYEHSACDLRILDNVFCNWRLGAIGADFRHAKIWCDGNCGTQQIYGLRWRCIECFAVDLCSDCYMSGKHDITHRFMRVESSIHSSMGPKMPPRSTSKRLEVKGIFPGARVVEYQHKSTGSVDQEFMKVIKDKNPFKEPRKGRIVVKHREKEKRYELSPSYMYVVRVPVACTLDASGGWVYVDHLPVIAACHIERLSLDLDATPNFEDDIEESYGDHDDMFPGNVLWRTYVAYREFRPKQNHFKNLTAAMRSNDVDAMTKILDKKPELAHYESSPGMSLLCCVAARGSVKMLKLLLERGANIESCGVRWMTPLMLSTIFKKHENVKCLLEQGAKVDAESRDTINSLYVACAQSDVECARLLLQHGADVNASGYGTMSAFQEACRRESHTILDMFVDRKDTDFKATADLLIKSGTCLHVAVEAKNAYAVSKIIERAPKIVEVKDLYDQTPLMVAARENASKCAEILIKMGRCDINPTDPEDGETALTIALLNGNLDVVGVLIENGADINVAPKTEDGFNSLRAAIGIRALKPNASYGYVPFLTEMKEKWRHIGVETDGDALLAYLVDHGASLHPKDNGGIPPTFQLLLNDDPMADALHDIWLPTRPIISTNDEESDDVGDVEEMDPGCLATRKRGGRGSGCGSSQPDKKCRLN